MMLPPVGRIPALDSIRYPAALLVVWLHVPANQLGGPLAVVVTNGYGAVSLFFMLSGFVLSLSYEEGDARRFWYDRLSRLYPLYLIGMVLALPQFLGMTANAGGPRVDQIVPAIFLVQAWIPSSTGEYALWNPPAWALSTEVAFYICFPFIFRALSRLDAWAQRAVAVAACCGAISFAAGYLVLIPDGLTSVNPESRGLWINLLRWHPAAHFPTFLAGVCGGLLFRRGVRVPRSGAALAIAAYLALLCWGEVPYVLLIAGAASPLLLIFILGVASAPPGWLERPWPVALGGASYALYITHAPLLRFVLPFMRLGLASPIGGWVGGWLGLLLGTAILSFIAMKFRRLEIGWMRRLRVWREGRVIPIASIAPDDARPATAA